jgi:uncharacterized protein YjbI with pentapeptide repeats
MGKDPPESESKAKGLISRLGRWAGFGDKTLWNILELLIVPAVLAIGAFYLEEQASNRQEQIADERYKQEQRIASSRYQQETLKAYFDQMTQLLLEKNLRNSKPESEVRSIARARTLTALRELDETRKGLLLKFLHEAKLISQNKTVVSLSDADLSGADLTGANLSHADLTGGKLTGGKLSGAYLSGAYLSYARLRGTDLRGAYLSGAYLRLADLEDANLTGTENLDPDRVKAAKNWERAKYSPDFRKQLGLPPEIVKGTESSKSTP